MGREYESNAYWMPEGVRAYLRGAGYSMRVLEDIEPHIRMGLVDTDLGRV